MDRFWLKNYPPGVPANIDASAYPNLAVLFEESFATYRDSSAYVCLGKALSFGEIDTLSQSLAAWLQDRGLRKGARVAIMMPNVLQYPIAVAAVLRAGLIAVNVNPLYTARELGHQLNDSGAEAVIVLDNFARTLEQALPGSAVKHAVVGTIGDLLGFPKGAIVNFMVRRMRGLVPAYSLPGHVRFNDAIARGRSLAFARPEIRPDDVAVLQYTGGTTGIAKGATLLHRTIVANLLASEAWMQPGLRRKKIDGQPTIVCALPLYHVFAFVTCGLLGLRTGALNVLIPDARDMKGTVRELAKHRINIFPGVNTLFGALLRQPGFGKLDFSGLAITNGGGMAVQEAVAKNWLALTGCPIVEGYGLSETASGVTCNPTDSEAYSGTVGLPMPNVEIRILDDQGNDVRLGQSGEIAIRGPQVMRDYWQQPDETAKVMTSDRFFKSGDIGEMDERGYLKLVDRKKDMIVVSGFKVYPNEIEAVMSAYPGIIECAAVGVPDVRSGEAVMLFVVTQDPKVTKEAIEAYCAKMFTGYKQPKYVEFRAELPKSNVGKVLRRQLRDQIAPKST